MEITLMIVARVIPVLIDISITILVIHIVNALQDMKMMALMKNVNNAQLKHILIIKNAKIVIILGTLIYYKCIIFSATCDGENY